MCFLETKIKHSWRTFLTVSLIPLQLAKQWLKLVEQNWSVRVMLRRCVDMIPWKKWSSTYASFRQPRITWVLNNINVIVKKFGYIHVDLVSLECFSNDGINFCEKRLWKKSSVLFINQPKNTKLQKCDTLIFHSYRRKRQPQLKKK